MREVGSTYHQLYFPIDDMMRKDKSGISLDESGGYYQRFFEGLAAGGSVLVCCTNGMHRSRREG